MAKLDRDGFAIVHDIVSADGIRNLLSALDTLPDTRSVRRREAVYGIRNLLEIVPAVGKLAGSDTIRALVEPILGPAAFPVRGIFFDKTPETNWNVPWHQDLSIAVRERRLVPGFGPWSQKTGVPHVQPPADILERMLTVRLHLDDCDQTSGPLRVIPGSHRHGRLNRATIETCRQQQAETDCLVPAGGVLLMRPLLLHASSDAQSSRHRRVIHLDFAASELPGGLQWHVERPDIERSDHLPLLSR